MTIVITAGLVGAGILTLHRSLGIIVGANVGTTVTGQIIRLLDIDASGASFLCFLQPSTLAPIALIIGIVLIMVRVHPELADHEHRYFDRLHAGGDKAFDEAYARARQRYFDLLNGFADASSPDQVSLFTD